MAICPECGRDPNRGVRPGSRRHGRVLDGPSLPPGAGSVSIEIGRDRRAALNRLAMDGVCLAEHVRRAIDAYLASQEIGARA